jgi:transketolase
MAIPTNIMRETMIMRLRERMADDRRIYFVSADFGAMSLDGLREDFPDRFINVGIAEQNCINVATGLALEGFTVFAYGIAPFISMRPYEQIRINLSLLSQTRPLNVNILSVGAGVSYDVSGPTHHCLEDISVMRTLPHVRVFSPCDADCARQFIDFALAEGGPKYARLDGKAQPSVYAERTADFCSGFSELRKGTDACIVSTGVMTHTALQVADRLPGQVGVVDAFMLDALDEVALADVLRPYHRVATLEEAFVGCGGLDSLISCVIERQELATRHVRFGFQRGFNFDNGGRLHLHRCAGIDTDALVAAFTNN